MSIHTRSYWVNRYISRLVIVLWLAQLVIPLNVNSPVVEDVTLTPFSPLPITGEEKTVYSSYVKDSGCLRVTHPFFPLPTSREGSLTNKNELPPSLPVGKGEKGMGYPQEASGFLGCGTGLPVLFLFGLFVEHFLAEAPNAAIRTWSGATDSSWSVGGNWVGGIPGPSDTALFDTNGTRGCNINTNPNVNRIQINGAYTRTINQKNSFAVTVGLGGFSQAGGTFTGGNKTLSISGGFSLTGGTFIAPSDTIIINGNMFNLNGGVFTHNNGTISFNRFVGSFQNDSVLITVPNQLNLNNLFYGGNGAGSGNTLMYKIVNNDTIVVNGIFAQRASGGGLDRILANNGVIQVNGSIVCGIKADGGTTNLLVTGSFSPTYARNGGCLPGLIVSTSGSLTAQGGTTSLAVMNFQLAAGTFSAPTDTFLLRGKNFNVSGGNYAHNGGMLCFKRVFAGSFINDTVSIDVPGKLMLGSLNFDAEGGNSNILSYKIIPGDTLAVNGSLSQATSGSVTQMFINSGTLEAQGNVSFTASSYGGTASMLFTGSNTQMLFCSGSWMLSGAWIVNKSSGSVILGSNVTFPGKLRILSGDISQGMSNSLTTGDSLIIGPSGSYTDTGMGALTLAGPVYNTGTMTVNSNGMGCGDAKSIMIRSTSNGVQRNWSGNGIFNIKDVDIKDQSSTPACTAWASINNGVSPNWTVNAGCQPGSLIFAEGTNNNRDTIAFTNQMYVNSGIHFTLQASSTEDVMIDTMKVALKKGNYTKIFNARLFRDKNSNHKLDTLTDDPIATASSFTAANMAIFSSVMPMGHMDTVAAGLTREYFLSLDFTGTLSSSDTFQVELTRDSIKAKGRSSFVGFKPGTGPAAIQGGKVIGGVGNLTLAEGTNNNRDTIAFTNQGYISSGINFTLQASSVEDIMVDTMKIALKKGEYTKISMARLFRDMNGNHKLDTLADYPIATASSFTAANMAIFSSVMPMGHMDTVADGPYARVLFIA